MVKDVSCHAGRYVVSGREAPVSLEGRWGWKGSLPAGWGVVVVVLTRGNVQPGSRRLIVCPCREARSRSHEGSCRSQAGTAKEAVPFRTKGGPVGCNAQWWGAGASQYPGKTQTAWALLGADPLVSGGLLPWLMLEFWGGAGTHTQPPGVSQLSFWKAATC